MYTLARYSLKTIDLSNQIDTTQQFEVR